MLPRYSPVTSAAATCSPQVVGCWHRPRIGISCRNTHGSSQRRGSCDAAHGSAEPTRRSSLLSLSGDGLQMPEKEYWASGGSQHSSTGWHSSRLVSPERVWGLLYQVFSYQLLLHVSSTSYLWSRHAQMIWVRSLLHCCRFGFEAGCNKEVNSNAQLVCSRTE